MVLLCMQEQFSLYRRVSRRELFCVGVNFRYVSFVCNYSESNLSTY